MVTRRRAVSKVRVLPPEVVSLSKEDEQQAVQALSTMIAQWWREHGQDGDPTQLLTPPDHDGTRLRTAMTVTSGP
jgi:hypothetical protein